MRTVNVHEAKTTFSRLLAEIEQGRSIVICRNGEPIADLVPHKSRSRLKFDRSLAPVEINYDPTEPLAEDEWPKAHR